MQQVERVEQLLAKQDLHELVASFCRAVDRSDEAGIVSLFHEGAVIDTGVIRAEREAFARQYIEWAQCNARTLFHLVSNEYYEINGSKAKGEVYVLAVSCLLTQNEGEFTYHVTGGRYLDRFEKRIGIWRFSERRFVLDSTVQVGASDAVTIVEQTAGMLTGSLRGPDPSHNFWNRPC